MIRKLLAFMFLALVIGSAIVLIVARERAADVESFAASGTNHHRAMWYDKLAGGLVHCRLCPNDCRLSEGETGICRARMNLGGELYSMVYGKIASAHVDPIEKKPFFHVLPGSTAFSIATPGCNMRCLFCQNWEISQAFPWEVRTSDAPPEQVVEAAVRSGARSIAFTYTEPTIFYEYMYDIARLAKQRGLKTVVISNGYINQEPLRALLPFIDAYKVDFKAFNPEFYTDLTGGSLEPVLASMKTIREQGVWLEIVTLLVPGRNDSEAEVRSLSRWIRENLGPDVPLHFSRFHPQHKMLDSPPTPVETVIRARRIALDEGLHFVYTGNVAYPPGETTYDPASGEAAIERRGHFVVRNNMKGGRGPGGSAIPGIWE